MKTENIVKSFRFRIMPTAEQEEILRRYEGACCMLWNAGIDYQDFRRKMGRGVDLHAFKHKNEKTGESRIKEYWEEKDKYSAAMKKWEGKTEKWRLGGKKDDAPKEPKKPLMPGKLRGNAYFNQGGEEGLAAQWALLRNDPDFSYLLELNSEAVRYTLNRLDKAYSAAFDRLKRGEKEAGFPKHKKRRDFCSFTVPSGNAAIKGENLRFHALVKETQKETRGEKKTVKNRVYLEIRMRPRKGKDENKERQGFKVEGKITDVVIKREGLNGHGKARWFAYIQCKIENAVIQPPPNKKHVGIDANVGNIAWADEDGKSDIIRMPKKELERMEVKRKYWQKRASWKEDRALRKLAEWDGKSETRKTAQARLGKIRAQKVDALKIQFIEFGMEEWRAFRMAQNETPRVSQKHAIAELRAAKASRLIKQIRDDFTHRVSAKFAAAYGTIVVEKLKLKNMTKSAAGTKKNPGKNVAQKRGLNRAMLGSAHAALKAKLMYKAEWNGGKAEEINPAYTSQECSECHDINPKSRKATELFVCRTCGHTENAQTNAAKNILNKFFRSHGRKEGLVKTSAQETAAISPARDKKRDGDRTRRKTPIKQTANTPKTAIKQPDKPNGDSLPFV